jgi:hypothetical protein
VPLFKTQLKKKMFTIKTQKVFFIIGLIFCLLGIIFVLNIFLLSVGSVFLYNILNFIFCKLLLFICVIPVVFLISWSIISGFFGIDVKQKYLTEINKPYIYIYIFIFTFISMFLIKYNVTYADNVQNNFSLVLQGSGQQISLTSTGIDYFSKTLDLLGNFGVMAGSIKVVGNLLSKHPELGMGPKTGYLILGTSGTLITYNIIKSLNNIGVGESPVVSTTITLSNTNIPVNTAINTAGAAQNILSIDKVGQLDLLLGLNEKLFSVNNQVSSQLIKTQWGYQKFHHINLTCNTNSMSKIFQDNPHNPNVSSIIQQVQHLNPNWQAQQPSNWQQQIASGSGRGYGGSGSGGGFGSWPSSIIDDISGDTMAQIIQLLTNMLYLNSITISLSILLLFVFSARLYIIKNSNALDVIKNWPLGKYLYWFVNRFINAWGKGSIIWIYSIMFLTIYFNCVIGYALWHILAIIN